MSVDCFRFVCAGAQIIHRGKLLPQQIQRIYSDSESHSLSFPFPPSTASCVCARDFFIWIYHHIIGFFLQSTTFSCQHRATTITKRQQEIQIIYIYKEERLKRPSNEKANFKAQNFSVCVFMHCAPLTVCVFCMFATHFIQNCKMYAEILRCWVENRKDEKKEGKKENETKGNTWTQKI